MKITLDVFEGEISEEEQAMQLEHVAKMLREGYSEGEITGENYRGWWKTED